MCFAIYSANYSKRNAQCQLRIVFCLLTVPKVLASLKCLLGLANYLPSTFRRLFFMSMLLHHHLVCVGLPAAGNSQDINAVTDVGRDGERAIVAERSGKHMHA